MDHAQQVETTFPTEEHLSILHSRVTNDVVGSSRNPGLNEGVDSDSLSDDSDIDIETVEEYNDIGDPSWLCDKCNASMWYDERVQKQRNPTNPNFSLCCNQGKIKIASLKEPPQLLKDLFCKRDVRSKYFLKHIRAFNMMFSFTSMGGKINTSINDGHGPPQFIMCGENYHQMGSLLPPPGAKPKFAQLYIYTTLPRKYATGCVLSEWKMMMQSLRASIVNDIKEMLDECNPYVKVYRSIRDRFQQQDVPNLRLKLIGKSGRDGRRYNVPNVSEVAALIVGDFDAADGERDIIVETQSRLLRRVSVFKEPYLPLQYPLLFPRGEAGILLNDSVDNSSKKRQTVSMREFFAYRIQDREIEPGTLMCSRRLFQQFLVDAYSMIESRGCYMLGLIRKNCELNSIKDFQMQCYEERLIQLH